MDAQPGNTGKFIHRHLCATVRQHPQPTGVQFVHPSVHRKFLHNSQLAVDICGDFLDVLGHGVVRRVLESGLDLLIGVITVV